MVISLSEDDISIRRAWKLWVCFIKINKLKYPFKIFPNKLSVSFLLNSIIEKRVEFIMTLFEEKRILT